MKVAYYTEGEPEVAADARPPGRDRNGGCRTGSRNAAHVLRSDSSRRTSRQYRGSFPDSIEEPPLPTASLNVIKSKFKK